MSQSRSGWWRPRVRWMFSEISERASPASISQAPHLARSPRETIPTTLPASSTGSRRTCFTAIIRGDHGTVPGHDVLDLDLVGVLLRGDAPGHDVPVGDDAPQAAVLAAHREGAQVVTAEEAGRQGGRLRRRDGDHTLIHEIAYLHSKTPPFGDSFHEGRHFYTDGPFRPSRSFKRRFRSSTPGPRQVKARSGYFSWNCRRVR